MRVFPSPFKGNVFINIVGLQKPASLSIYNVDGELCYKLTVKGDGVYLWTGKDLYGRGVPPGVYIISLDLSQRIARKVIYIGR
jgi:hypothetical protein